MITAAILVAMESGPAVLTISVKSAVEALPESGLKIDMETASIGTSRNAKTP
jgi:hypothetical protein